jgi:XTP/dITP diphosphohydrolase
MNKLLIASTNSGKIKEVRTLLEGFSFQIIGLDEYPQLMNIEEDGDTFKENALKKARVSAEETDLLTLADDSGLVVDHLNGRPGIYSARFAGENATDHQNNIKLLEELRGVDEKKRSAHFRCAMALVDPENNREEVVEGRCEGRILSEPRGENGFGYDPLFYISEYEKTMAQLPSQIKNKISHRTEALTKMKGIVRKRYKDV